MKRTPKQRMKVRRDRFVVGYLGAKNLLFSTTGYARDSHSSYMKTTSLEPMTLLQARRLLAKMPCAGCAIFELIPVEINR